jgi:2-amino-4-hydroxy-6-hydroxymethyldihydropteridine diphosphokinase
MTNHKAQAYLSLGSNIQPELHLLQAIQTLRSSFEDVRVSPIYRTPAVGFEGADFLNAALALQTDLDPAALNCWLHDLEHKHGRTRDGSRWSSRTLDIDIVLYDQLIMDGAQNLQIPRKELIEQAFVLKPMVDIAPDLIHPVLGQSLQQLWLHFSGDKKLEKINMS